MKNIPLQGYQVNYLIINKSHTLRLHTYYVQYYTTQHFFNPYSLEVFLPVDTCTIHTF